MLVAIPSKGRAGQTTSGKLISSAVYFVPESELKDYERLESNDIQGVPIEVRGITATRNWILDWTDDERVVFIDDDVKAAGWVELQSESSTRRELDECAWLAEWVKLFEVTEQLGYRIWGLDTIGALRSVYPYRPFIFHTYVTASCMGMLKSGLRFDADFPVKEDYELCLRCIKEDGGVVGARYLYWHNEHWNKAGGCKTYRTQEVEKDAIERLIEMYPGMIRRVERGGSQYSIQLQF